MRAKWSAPIRKYWKISEQMMVRYCDLAICDSVNIDALRSFGCLAIIAWHVKANTNFNGGGVLTERIIPSFDYLVYLFMIISGFGMCNGYYQKLKDGNYDLNKFYSRRYKKTVPFFSILIIVNCILEFNRENIFEGLMEITMLFGFLPNNSLSVIGVAWTLGAIFAFYLYRADTCLEVHQS